MTEHLRRVSVIAPCFNERGHVLAFCDAVARQELPARVEMEVLVADGMSDDGTRDLLRERCAKDPRFILVDNPGRIVSCGLNRCLERARGDAVVRMDLHTDYAPDYIVQCLLALEKSGADNVGGPWRAAADAGHPTQQAIAAAFQSRWLAGGARSRQLDYSGWVDTVYLGCWPRQTFQRFGGFDENLVRNQDDEHNLRIVRGGGRVWQSASIRSSYRPRDSIRGLFRQYLQYGYWKPFVMRKHGQPAALRHLMPGLLVLALSVLLTAALLGAPNWPVLLLSGLYCTMVLCAAGLIAASTAWRLLPRLPGVIVAYHMGYGLGSVLGWFDVLSGAKTGRPGFARITR